MFISESPPVTCIHTIDAICAIVLYLYSRSWDPLNHHKQSSYTPDFPYCGFLLLITTNAPDKNHSSVITSTTRLGYHSTVRVTWDCQSCCCAQGRCHASPPAQSPFLALCAVTAHTNWETKRISLDSSESALLCSCAHGHLLRLSWLTVIHQTTAISSPVAHPLGYLIAQTRKKLSSHFCTNNMCYFFPGTLIFAMFWLPAFYL